MQRDCLQQLVEISGAAIRSVAGILRLVMLSVLAIAEPLVIRVLAAIVILCAVLTLFFGVLVRAPHFPWGVVLGIGGASVIVAALYYAILGALMPD